MKEDTRQERSTPVNPYAFSRFPLYEHKTPVFTESRRGEYIKYGDNNDYPDYLTYLFNRSALHAAIVRGKVNYIYGKGWAIDDTKGDTILQAKCAKILQDINGVQTLDELTYELLIDWIVYGGYYLKVNKIAGRIISIKVVSFPTVRTNATKSHYFVSNEWTSELSLDNKFKNPGDRLPKDVKIYERFDPTTSNGEEILCHADIRPSMLVYPLPEYEAAIAAVETEIEIRNYDLNNIKTGFAAGTMLTMKGGTPDEEKKREYERQLKGKVSGSDNAGELIINWQQPGVDTPEIINLRNGEIANQMEQIDPRIQQAVISGHLITSGMLFGIKESGQLGGRNELQTAWELLYNTYVRPKQIEIEKTFNYLLKFYGLPTMIHLQQLEPIGMGVDISHIQDALTPEEFSEYIKEKIGYKSKKTFAKEKPTILHRLCNELGEHSDNFEIVAEGEPFNFAEIAGLEGENEKVYRAMVDNKNITLARLSEVTNIPQGKLLQIIERLQKGNYIVANMTEVRGQIRIQTDVNIESTEPEEGFRLETRWKYTWANPADAATIDRSRDFCREMLRSSRMYTRAELEGLTNDMDGDNTSVWRYRGGWYHNPETGINTPYCRHYWKSFIVRRRIQA